MSKRPDTDDLVSHYPAHVPMGLPLPPPDSYIIFPEDRRRIDDDRPDEECVL